MAVPMELSSEDRRELERLEEELWRVDTRFDLRRMEEIMAPDFFEFGRSGRIYRRADTLAVSPRPIDATNPLPNFQARLIAPTVAQVTYDSAVKHDGVMERARRCSIWSRDADGWMLQFHQGTPFVDDV